MMRYTAGRPCSHSRCRCTADLPRSRACCPHNRSRWLGRSCCIRSCSRCTERRRCLRSCSRCSRRTGHRHRCMLMETHSCSQMACSRTVKIRKASNRNSQESCRLACNYSRACIHSWACSHWVYSRQGCSRSGCSRWVCMDPRGHQMVCRHTLGQVALVVRSACIRTPAPREAAAKERARTQPALVHRVALHNKGCSCWPSLTAPSPAKHCGSADGTAHLAVLVALHGSTQRCSGLNT